MSWTKITCLLSFCALLAAPVMADPTASLTGVESGGNFDWTLSFAPDAGLFTNPADDNPDQGMGGSLATAFQIETAAGGLIQDSWAIASADFMGGLAPPLDINPGVDPYAGGITEGVVDYSNVASDFGAAGMVDAIFVPLAGTFFTSGGDKAALTFSTTTDTVTFGGLIAQAGNEYMIGADTVVVPGGSFADFNEDNFVDDLDLAAFFGQWMNMSDSFADFNDDGTVDDLDLAAFFGQWSPAAGSLAASNAVPEPSAIAMIGMGLAGLGLTFRRK